MPIVGFWGRVKFLAGYGDYVLVPKEPTKAMLQAACDALWRRPTKDWVTNKEKHRIRYRAMIEAVTNGDMT